MSAPGPCIDLYAEAMDPVHANDRILSCSVLRDEDPIAQIYSDAAKDMESVMPTPTITAVDHYILSTTLTSDETKASEGTCKALTVIEEEDSVPIIDAAPVLPTVVEEIPEGDENEAENVLSSSMQSLVDGLMSWGGQYDSEEDLNLPIGMATSIVLEGSGIAGVN